MKVRNKFIQHGRLSKLKLFCFIAPFFLIPCVALAAFGLENATGDNIEAQVKAACIYNFTKFIYWDASNGSGKTGPITIYVLGADQIGDLLEGFLKKQTDAHSFIVKSSRKKTDDIANCQLLFISRSVQQQMPAILKQLEGTNVLTVSDIPGFARHGGMIGFIIVNSRINIEINLAVVNRAGLKMSAKLLEVAKIVTSEE
jgi:hypothetical protein